MNSDSIMLDSPAQTPTPKSHPPPPNGTSSDVAMTDNAAVAQPINWLNNAKWTEEYQVAEGRLLHRETFKRREESHPA